MREFFKGWRRKFGCLLLLAACALIVLWFRALHVEDVILSGDGKGTINSWHVSRRSVFWNRYTGIVMKPGLRWEQARGSQMTASGPSRVFLTREKIDFVRNSDWSVFGSGEIQNELKVKMSFCYVSFWSIVLPLTFLSAYLILWKPRRKESRDA